MTQTQNKQAGGFAKSHPQISKLIDQIESEENDTNSTYCEQCGCRITAGRCKHGVMPPKAHTPLTIDDLWAQRDELQRQRDELLRQLKAAQAQLFFANKREGELLAVLKSAYLVAEVNARSTGNPQVHAHAHKLKAAIAKVEGSK